MGDRAYCNLFLKTDPTPELLRILNDELGAPSDTDGSRCFGYEEVNWAQLPQPIYDYCHEHKLPFAWVNEDGGSYGPSVVLFDGEGRIDWPLYEGDLVLTVPEAKSAETVAAAERWQALLDEVRRGDC